MVVLLINLFQLFAYIMSVFLTVSSQKKNKTMYETR